MSKKFKISLLIISLTLILVYIATWFYVAHNLRNYLQEQTYKTESQTLSIKKVRVTGFPFKLKVAATDINYTQHIENQVTNSTVEFSAENISAETSLLFNKVVLNFPAKSSLSLANGDQKLNLDIASKDHLLAIKELSFINTHKIIVALINKANNIDYKISDIIYHNDDFKVTNRDTQQEWISGNADTNIEAVYQADGSNRFALRADNNFKVTNDNSIKNCVTKIDFFVILTPKDDVFSLNAADVKVIEFKVNDLVVNLSGKFNSVKDRQIDIDMKLGIKEARRSITELVELNKLSHERMEIMNSLFLAITGEDMNDNMEIKIYNSKDMELRVGHLEISDLTNYIQHFIMSK